MKKARANGVGLGRSSLSGTRIPSAHSAPYGHHSGVPPWKTDGYPYGRLAEVPTREFCLVL